ncbi:MAG: TolB family protein [Rhodothermales bacterium]
MAEGFCKVISAFYLSGHISGNYSSAASHIKRFRCAFLRILVLITFLVCLPTNASAQLLGYGTISRPGGTKYQVLTTNHFEIIFEEGYLGEAKATVKVLEAHLTETQSLLAHHHTLRMPVVLNGFNDLSNGFVTPLPFKQEIEITYLKGRSLSPIHTSWLDTVMPHELVHSVQADLRKGFGIGSIIRPFFPDAARTINLLVPPGISEGVAVYHESRHKAGAGRLNHSFFTMRFRAAMMSAKPWSMAQLVEAPAYTRPLDRFYLGGAHLVDYLAASDSLAFFHRSSALNYRIPLLGYGIGLWYGTKQWPGKVYKRFKKAAIDEEHALQNTLGDVTEPEILYSSNGMLQRRPLWLSDDELVVYARGYNVRGGFYVHHVRSGKRRLLRNTATTEDFNYNLSSDRTRLFYAHYNVDPSIAIKRIADLYEIEIATGEQSQRSSSQRLLVPTPAKEGALWALQNRGQYNQLVRIDHQGQVVQSSTLQHVRFQDLAVSPDQKQLIGILNIKGFQGVYALSENDTEITPEPWIVLEKGAVYDVAWSPDGKHILFTADPSGISNIYLFEIATRKIIQITNARYGAFEPSLSPDGKTLVYIDYQHERFDLVRLPFDLTGATMVEEARLGAKALLDTETQHMLLASLSEKAAPADTAQYKVSRYKALAHLKPRSLLPIIRPSENVVMGASEIGVGVGLAVQGADPLQKYSYQLQGYNQAGRLWGSATIQAGGGRMQPYLSVYNLLSTLTVSPEPIARLSTESTSEISSTKIGIERRGVTAGIRLPMVFHRNVFQSGMVLGVQSVWEREQFIDDAPLKQNQQSIEPAATFYYRLQTNPRDLIPNHGLLLSLNATLDTRNDPREKNRALISRLTAYLPFFRNANVGLQVYGSILSQNQGGIYNLDNFLPRGYEDNIFLAGGNHAVVGFEYIQPLWYVDNGLFMIPVYLKALYAFGFTEGLFESPAVFVHEAERFESKSTRAFASGAGIGLKFRVLYLFNFDVRFTAAYRHLFKDWDFRVR